ncbi:MAG: hypothetical protein M1828_006552 [Chrysothrix sp. TS-e1954]|nr:MAG: hypothetical protein M1828_006552 [Chrysothrix sp. TS-e1954]
MADEGATPRELILEACRRNNTELLEEVLSNARSSGGSKSQEKAVADLINNSRDGMGNASLHVAASAGSYDVMDHLLDQSLVETDPLTRRDQETPLHLAVHYLNTLPSSSWAETNSLVHILLDAGCDPRIRNKGKMSPVQIVDPRNTGLRDMLRKAEVALMAGDDVVNEDEEDDDAGGPPSDSD